MVPEITTVTKLMVSATANEVSQDVNVKSVIRDIINSLIVENASATNG